MAYQFEWQSIDGTTIQGAIQQTETEAMISCRAAVANAGYSPVWSAGKYRTTEAITEMNAQEASSMEQLTAASYAQASTEGLKALRPGLLRLCEARDDATRATAVQTLFDLECELERRDG
jgi:hypothetical protein